MDCDGDLWVGASGRSDPAAGGSGSDSGHQTPLERSDEDRDKGDTCEQESAGWARENGFSPFLCRR